MKSNQDDYMKFWRVIRYYVKRKYGLSQEDLDMLFFLYSEVYFGKAKFDEYATIMPWSKTRFASLYTRGWLETFRKAGGRRRAVYKLTNKANRVIRIIYKKLSGEEIPTSYVHNRMFLKKNVPYSDKVYRNMIIKMNDYLQQQQRPSHE